ncbi:hypothetical protein QQP08_021737 [Theobroma cacao]|nr:hypothetical protein QQP08_021737 [Theobroma cacao]
MDQLYKIKSKWYAFVVASTFSSKVNHVKCKNAVILIRTSNLYPGYKHQISSRLISHPDK